MNRLTAKRDITWASDSFDITTSNRLVSSKTRRPANIGDREKQSSSNYCPSTDAFYLHRRAEQH